MQIQVEHGAIEFGVVNRSLRRRDRRHRSDDIGSSSSSRQTSSAI